MNAALQRRIPALLTLLGVTLLAAASYWALELAQRSQQDAPMRAARTEPDYIIDQFRYVAVAQDGKAKYVIEGERLLHDPVTDDSTVEQPRLRSYAPGRAPMTLRARSALVNGDHSEIRLRDAVRLERPQARGSEALTVESDQMLVLPKQDIVSTERPVQARIGDDLLNGVGMVADNQQKVLTLNSRVSATFNPSR